MSTHSLPPNDEVPRDFGTAEIGGHDLASELLKNGWAKVKELKRDPTDEDTRKRELENEAKAAGKGLWNPHGPQVHPTYPLMVSRAHLLFVGACCTPHYARGLISLLIGMERKIH